MDAELHVIFGAGQVGYPLAELLLEAGKRVRIAKRSSGGVPTGVDVVVGDALNPDFCREAARSAVTIYHCMNPPYDSRIWAEQVPRMMSNLIAAAEAAGARLVVLDNVYALGKPNGKALNEATPMIPCSPLGEVRARASDALFLAHQEGRLLATMGRASDFYGPRGTLTHVGDQFWQGVMKGKPARVVVDPDAIHTYHYIPDVARGLFVLGTADDSAYGHPWMLPCQPAETLRQLSERFATHLGRPVRITQMPHWLLKTASWFAAPAREIDRMLYQWAEPFVIDDQKFRARFEQGPIDRDQAAAETVAWARKHYGVRGKQAA